MSAAEVRGGSGALAGSAFFRAHGLGNDYLVFGPFEPGEAPWAVGAESVRRICDRHEGVGGDGIVVLCAREPADGIFPLRMFNPDGSEFERSGNGLRILAAYLHREGLVGEAPFRVRSGGDEIGMTVHGVEPSGQFDISVEMGRARVGLEALGIDAGRLDSLGRAVHPEFGPIAFHPVTVGNPHAVLFPEEPVPPPFERVGPFLATHPAFPEGTNVQEARVLGPGRLHIRIWERGVGATSASGTSSCAAAAAAVQTGRLEAGPLRIEMEGGILEVEVSPELDITLRGPVVEISEGRLTPGFLRSLDRSR